MNDTKWREVLCTASRLELWFVAAFVGRKEPILPGDFNRDRLSSPYPEIAFERHHIGDWGSLCGSYKSILWVLYPRRFFFVVEGGRKLYREQRIPEFLIELAQFGKVPTEDTESFVRVNGYKSPASKSG